MMNWREPQVFPVAHRKCRQNPSGFGSQIGSRTVSHRPESGRETWSWHYRYALRLATWLERHA